MAKLREIILWLCAGASILNNIQDILKMIKRMLGNADALLNVVVHPPM